MSLALSFENGYSNGFDFFTAMEGGSQEQVLAAVVKMRDSFNSVPAGLGGAVLKSTDGGSIAVYQMWVKETDLGEYADELSADLEEVESIADINSNFFEPVVAEGKQEGVKFVLEKDCYYGIQVFAVEAEKWEGVLEECHKVMKELLNSVEDLDWFIILRSWDKSKLGLLTKSGSSSDLPLRDSVFSPVELGLKDVGIIKEVENAFQVVEL